ncbi:MAG: response regulator [bacterium]
MSKRQVDDEAVTLKETGQRAPVGSVVLRILVAEDNKINQEVAKGILSEMMGHTVVLANNGREALDILETVDFDLVFMDVQMPVMDGFETTAEIRRREEETGNHIPIVAMTANVMKGDDKRCLEAGMDDYIPKPVRPDQVLECISNLFGGSSADEIDTTEETIAAALAGIVEEKEPAADLDAETQAASGQVFDKDTLLQWYGSNVEVLKELLGMYFSEIPTMLSDVRQSVEARDSNALDQTAHKLKGAVGTFEAKRAFEAAYALERMGKDSTFDGVEEALARLENEIQCLSDALVEFGKEMGVA